MDSHFKQTLREFLGLAGIAFQDARSGPIDDECAIHLIATASVLSDLLKRDDVTKINWAKTGSEWSEQ